MKISIAATTTIIDRKLQYVAPIPLESNVMVEDVGASEMKFNLRYNINSASTSTGNTYTMTLKYFKGDSSEALLIQIAKAKLVVKEVLLWSKEELRIFGSTIFEGFCKQNFLTAIERLSDDLEVDLDQVWKNLKLMYFNLQVKVMQKW